VAEKKAVTGNLLYDAAVVHAVATAACAKAELPQAERDQLSQRYAGRAVELLTRAHAGGYFKLPANLERLKKARDLEPLRSRADFQLLLRDRPKDESSHGPTGGH
jgi:hypothetical protein